jgi:hypothetical protein
MEDAVNHPTAGLSLRPNAGKASEGAAAVAERSVRVGAGDDEAGALHGAMLSRRWRSRS